MGLPLRFEVYRVVVVVGAQAHQDAALLHAFRILLDPLLGHLSAGMKAHIGMDADSGLVHTVRGTSANVNDVVEGNALLHGDEEVAFRDAGYLGVDKRPNASTEVTWHIAMRPGPRKKPG